MLNGLVHAHSGLRWILLIAMLYAIINAFSKKNKGKFEIKDKIAFLLVLIISHIQILLGIALFILEERWVGFKHMDIEIMRFYAVEHTLGMIISVVLITIGHSKYKKIEEDKHKFKKIATYYSIAFVIILISIPWPFRESLGGGWF